MAKALKTGEKAPRSGQHKARGPGGGTAAKELSSTMGKPLPPTPKAAHGITILESKSGRHIIASPATSATTVSMWSSAFRSKQ